VPAWDERATVSEAFSCHSGLGPAITVRFARTDGPVVEFSQSVVDLGQE
jgi:hypothetical protein